MMRGFFLFLSLVTIPLNAFSHELNEIDEELMTNIADFLEDQDIGRLTQVNKRFQDIFSRQTDTGTHLREKSTFSIVTKREKYFLKELLNIPARFQTIKINNIEVLLAQKPNDFMRLVLKSIPHSPETVKSDLRYFVKETLKIEKLIKSLPQAQTPQQKLASILVELITWDHVITEVTDQIWTHVADEIWTKVADHVWDQVKDHTWDQVRDRSWSHVMDEVNFQVRNQVDSQVGSQVMDLVRGQVGDQIEDEAWTKSFSNILDYVRDQLTDQLKDQLKEDLQHFQFGPQYREGCLNRTLKPAINFTFLLYQLGCISMKHCDRFKKIQNEFAEFISEKMNLEQIQTVLDGLLETIENQSHETYLIDTQMKLILRHLSSES